VLGALAAPGEKNHARQPQLLRSGKAGSLGHIRDHHGDLHALQPSGADRFRNGQKIRPAAGEQDAEANRRIIRCESQDFPQKLKHH